MPSALIVFAKVPEPGRVKTRLTEELSGREAADLYAAFLADALRAYGTLAADTRLYLAPSERSLPPALVPAGVSVHAQRGEGLGQRMLRAFVETFGAGYDRALVIGTDHPTLPLAFVEQAFAALTEPLSISIGPSEDGGYYLLGMNELYPDLFTGMRYSHGGVFEQTLERAAATGASVTILPAWYDVDTPADLRRLRSELEGSSGRLPQTRAALARLVTPDAGS